jgi:hypothetical protein
VVVTLFEEVAQGYAACSPPPAAATVAASSA